MHQNLWAPWRMAYLREMERKAADARAVPGAARAAASAEVDDALFLSRYWASPGDDEVNFIIHRDTHGMILLNRYPYANGHLMVALGEARPTLLDYDAPQRAALWNLITFATDLMQRTLNPQGINIGINQGNAAGAGVPGHLHGHLVPRWAGDTNFMTIVGQVRVIPDSLQAMAAQYRAALGARPATRH
jgi:ATP adenylyltransferase